MKKIFTILFIIIFNVCLVTFVIFSIGKLNNKSENIKGLSSTANLEKYEKHIGYYDNKKGSLFSERLDNAIFSLNAPIPFRKDAKWGYLDENGNVIIDFRYVEAKEFKNGLAVVKNDDKFGFINESGNVVIDFIYESAGNFLDNGMAIVVKDGKYGVIDKNGNVIINFTYEYIKNLAIEDFFAVKLEDGFTLLNIETKQISGLFFDDIKAFSDGVAAVKKGDKWGYIDKTGNLIISYKYDEAASFSCGIALVKENDKIGIIDTSGNWKKTIEAEEGGVISEDLLAIKVNGKWGFIDKDGNIVIDCVFDDAGYFYNGIANVNFDGKWGFIDKNGEVVIDFKYEFNCLMNFNDDGIALCFDDALNFGAINREDEELIIGNFEMAKADIETAYVMEGEDFINISKDEKNRILDLNGNEIISCEYDEAELIWDIVVIKKDEQYACFDKKGNLIIDFGKYQEIDHFSEGFILVSQNEKVGLLNTKGELVVPIEYDDIDYFRNDVAIIENNGKKGAIDKTGKVIIPVEYNDIGRFEQNTTWIEKNGMFGYVDKNGSFLTEFKYLEAYKFAEGLSIAFLDDGYVYIDEKGKIAIPHKYDDAADFKDGIANVILNGENTYINKKGEEIETLPLGYIGVLENKYDEIYLTDESKDACVVELDGRYGVINSKGEEIVKCIYLDADTEFNEYGLIIVKNEEGKAGIINNKGDIVVDFKYDDIEEYSEGYAPVKKGIYWGYIDVNGNEVISCEYIIAQSFSDGLAFVCKEYTNETKVAYYIDKNNKKVLDVSEYYVGMPFVDGRAVVVKIMPVHEVGVIDKEGNVIVGNFEN